MWHFCFIHFPGNGVIDFDEFSAWMQKSKQQAAATGAKNGGGQPDQQEMIQLFHIFDKDNDG